jgi:hypothetical protein
MLQSMQAEIGKFLRLGMGENRNHTAFIVKFVRNLHLAP